MDGSGLGQCPTHCSGVSAKDGLNTADTTSGTCQGMAAASVALPLVPQSKHVQYNISLSSSCKGIT